MYLLFSSFCQDAKRVSRPFKRTQHRHRQRTAGQVLRHRSGRRTLDTGHWTLEPGHGERKLAAFIQLLLLLLLSGEPEPQGHLTIANRPGSTLDSASLLNYHHPLGHSNSGPELGSSAASSSRFISIPSTEN